MRRRRPAKKHKIDKSALLYGEPERKHDELYRRWIASLPCCVTGISNASQCAHIRAQTGTGGGQKPSDIGNCVPLHWEQHGKQHRIGESAFWGSIERAKQLAADLGEIYLNGKDEFQAIVRIMRFKNEYQVHHQIT